MRPILVAALLMTVLVPAAPALPACSDTDPPNDCMVNAMVLTTRTANVWQDSTNAGVEPGEPGVGPDMQHTLWYKFTAFRASRGSFSVHDSHVQPGHYVYEMQTDGTLRFLDGASGWSSMPWTLFDCVAGRDYYIQVGVEEGYDGGMMNLYGSTCQLGPEAPRAPTLTARTGAALGTVELSWTTPDDGGAPISGYNVYKATSGCGGMTLLATGDASASSYVATGLQHGIPACFEVRALNAVGAGAPSGLAAAYPAGAPSPVRALAATNGPEQIALRWVAPANDGGSPVTTYRVHLAGGPLLAETTSLTHVDAGLADGTTRSYEVRAVNAHGESPPVVVTGRAWRAPDAPGGVNAGPNFPTGVRITWNAPADDGGTPLVKYQVLRGPKGGAMAPIGDTQPGTRVFVDQPPLIGGYDYAVVAWNARGASPVSARDCGEQLPLPSTVGGC